MHAWFRILLIDCLSQSNRSGQDVWNKSIEICTLKGDCTDLVACSEHPVTLEDGTANVPWIQEKAFSGARVRLLNVKNIPIADTEGTSGVCTHYLLLPDHKIIIFMTSKHYLKVTG